MWHRVEYFFERPRSLIVVPVASGAVCSNYSCRWPQEQQLLSLAQGYCCDTGSLTRLFPAALFWYWPPVTTAQSIYGSLRRPALQYACIRHNGESTA